MVLHSWITKAMEMCGVADKLSHLLPKSIPFEKKMQDNNLKRASTKRSITSFHG